MVIANLQGIKGSKKPWGRMEIREAFHAARALRGDFLRLETKSLASCMLCPSNL